MISSLQLWWRCRLRYFSFLTHTMAGAHHEHEHFNSSSKRNQNNMRWSVDTDLLVVLHAEPQIVKKGVSLDIFTVTVRTSLLSQILTLQHQEPRVGKAKHMAPCILHGMIPESKDGRPVYKVSMIFFYHASGVEPYRAPSFSELNECRIA